MEQFLNAEVLDRISGLGILVVVAILTITDKLVWHTRYKAACSARDKWENIALDAMRVSARTSLATAEAAVGVVSALPDPQTEHATTLGG